jgi:hypothetical protein
VTANKLLAALASLAVVVAVGAGLYLGGSPGDQRLLRLDERRVQDLRTLAAAIDAHWSAGSRLPADLAQLLTAQRLRSIPTDPVSEARYEYAPADGQYSLCATFARPSRDAAHEDFWAHGAGRHCFAISPNSAFGVPRRD